LPELCLYPTVLKKAKLTSYEIQYLAGEISEQKFEVAAWLLVNIFSEMSEEGNCLKMDFFFSKRSRT
jgi:hypothetical protein